MKTELQCDLITHLKNYVVLGLSFLAFITHAAAQSWCIPAMPTSNDAGVTNVTLNTINRTSGIDEGYVLTSESTTLNPDGSYTLSVTFGGTEASAPVVWIDWNRDGEFADSESITGFSWYPTFPDNTQELIFTVPSDAVKGETRMRVYAKAGITGPPRNACATTDAGGDIEDYVIDIQDAVIASLHSTSFNPKDQIHVYPSPTSSSITIDTKGFEDITSIKVYNGAGQTVYWSEAPNTFNNSINIDGEPGIYIVEVSSAQRTERATIVKE